MLFIYTSIHTECEKEIQKPSMTWWISVRMNIIQLESHTHHLCRIYEKGWALYLIRLVDKVSIVITSNRNLDKQSRSTFSNVMNMIPWVKEWISAFNIIIRCDTYQLRRWQAPLHRPSPFPDRGFSKHSKLQEWVKQWLHKRQLRLLKSKIGIAITFIAADAQIMHSDATTNKAL